MTEQASESRRGYVHLCPIEGCPWTHTEPWSDDTRGLILQAFNVPGSMVTNAVKVEKILRDHLDTHDLADWVRSLTDLRAKARELKERLDAETDRHEVCCEGLCDPSNGYQGRGR